MKAIILVLGMIVVPTCWGTSSGADVSVVVAERAPELERYAAAQLCVYLEELFKIRTQPVAKMPQSSQTSFLVGTAATNELIRNAIPAQVRTTWNIETIVIKRVIIAGRQALILTGGSSRAVLWAVSELVERTWGVRYLLHGDVLPAHSTFRLPDSDLKLNPLLTVRQWRVLNEFACGPLSWGMTDYRGFIDQLAKMKFNRLLLSLWPHQPFADYSVRGVHRSSAAIFFGYHFPITNDMIGRGLFGAQSEFWNPDLPITNNYKELSTAFQKLIHNLISYAHQRGMECVLSVSATEFPPEFAKVLPGAEKGYQVNSLVIRPGTKTSVNEPALHELAGAVIKSLVNTYPEMDALGLNMPEHRQWVDTYETAWQELDARYGIAKILGLSEVIETARHRPGYDGTEDRKVREVKGDIVALNFYDKLLRDEQVLKGTRQPGIKIIPTGVAEELLPVLGRVLGNNSETLNQIDYSASRILKRPQVLAHIPGTQTPSVLIFTLHDDNVGLLPQLTTQSLAKLTELLKRYQWAGYSTRYWLIGDHDPTAAYIAKASWENDTTPDGVTRDQLRSICGSACVEDMFGAMKEVENATSNLEMNAPSLAFPVPNMMLKHWVAEPMPKELIEARDSYRKASNLANRALPHSTANGKSYITYWMGRLQFAIYYLDAIEQVRLAATAESAHRLKERSAAAKAALENSRKAIASYVAVVQDQSDRGAIATLNEYVYRPLKAKVAGVVHEKN